MRVILNLLKGAENPNADQAAFLKSQILFWPIGATDGHAKNFSIFLRPGNSYSLTPFYDVLSTQPAVDQGQTLPKRFRLAMAAGKDSHYRIDAVMGRHFVQSAQAAGVGLNAIRDVIADILSRADTAAAQALSEMPADSANSIHTSLSSAIGRRLPRLKNALDGVADASN